MALVVTGAALSSADEGRLKIATTSSLYDTGLLETIVDKFTERSSSFRMETVWRGGASPTTTSTSWDPRTTRLKSRD
ncbi:MAG: hypothetical protein LUQ30_04115 [Methanothrix sp.]|nr:hypothetical protein [Methanothrix sp.]